MSIALAKQFLMLGKRPRFLSSSNHHDIKAQELKKYDVFIFDDFNSGYGIGADAFLRVVIHVFDHGGKIFLTTNSAFEEILDNMIGPKSIRKADGARYRDRMKNMFLILELKGDSHRNPSPWYSEPGKF